MDRLSIISDSVDRAEDIGRQLVGIFETQSFPRQGFSNVAPQKYTIIDIDLDDGVGDEEYLEKLGAGCRKGMSEFRPQLIAYVAGADPYREDQLGGLSLTIDGLKRRDRLVFDLAREHDAPAVVTLAGGYAVRVEDTVTIHCNTAKAAAEALSGGVGR